MITKNTYVYVRIGLYLRFLQTAGTNWNANLVKEAIGNLRQFLQEGTFDVSLAMIQSERYITIKKELEAIPEGGTLSAELAKKVANLFASLEDIVFAEGMTKKIYTLASRRFNTDYLLEQPESLLKAGSFSKLEEIARTDFASSCRCILFGEATAAAFHILRATESVLKSYYYHHRRQNRLDKPMWANMLDQLKTKAKNKPPASLLASLDLIRTTYRNPTQHPEAVYGIDSAQDLFGVCLDAIGKMTDEL